MERMLYLYVFGLLCYFFDNIHSNPLVNSPQKINLYDVDDPCSNNGTNVFAFGNKATYDRVLFYTRVMKKNSTEKDIITRSDINYPSEGSLKRLNISCIEIIDLSYEYGGHGGISKIISGGPGHKNVTIRLESLPGYGFDYLIKIFGCYLKSCYFQTIPKLIDYKKKYDNDE